MRGEAEIEDVSILRRPALRATRRGSLRRSRQTITLRFSGKGPQSVWLSRLEEPCQTLVAERVLAEAHPQAVFPHHPEPAMAALFTVECVGGPPDLAALFRPLRDLVYTERAATRRTLPRTA